jgi:hypothetical protein
MARQVPLPFGSHSFYDEAPGSSGPMQTPSIAFRYAILHAIGNCTHFLTPLMAMIWIIGQQAWHEGPVWALEPNLAAELAHSNFAIIARGARFQGTSIWFNHWRSEDTPVPAMRNSKKQKRADWRFTMEQLGREFRKAYPPSANLPRRLRALVTQLERKAKYPGRRNRGHRE